MANETLDEAGPNPLPGASAPPAGTLSWRQRAVKRGFDLVFALPGLVLLLPVILIAALLAWRDTGASGFFGQTRIGRGGKAFTLWKIRTMYPVAGTNVTVAGDSRITPLGARLRRWKIDELPQLWNVIRGEMSLVGPRPDVPGYADQLTGEARAILSLRPGITGPATLKYAREEEILALQTDPERYNDEEIWPDKVALNMAYLRGWSLRRDLRYILATFGWR